MHDIIHATGSGSTLARGQRRRRLWKRRPLAAVGLLLGLLSVACTGGGGGGSFVPCTPGDVRACTCFTGASGEQACPASARWGICQCSDGGIGDLALSGPRDFATSRPPDLRMERFTCDSTSPCWANCASKGNGTSTCAGICGVGDGVDCWQLCGDKGNGTSTCAGICTAQAGCPRALCWRLCEKLGNGTSTCKGICGVDKTPCSACSGSPSGYSMCWAVCTAAGNGPSTCTGICGM